MGKGNTIPSWNYKMEDDTIEEMDEGKDLGAIIQNNLSPGKHISRIQHCCCKNK